jgi:hypothetical protein
VTHTPHRSPQSTSTGEKPLSNLPRDSSLTLSAKHHLCKKARRTNVVSMLADGDELPRKNKVPSHRRYR